MTPLVRSALVALGAFLIPVAMVVAATAFAHAKGAPPFDPDWPMYAIVAGLAIGVAAIAQIPLTGTLKRFLILVVYVPICSTILWGASYLTGCFSGAC